VAVQVAAGRGVDQTDCVAVAENLNLFVLKVRGEGMTSLDDPIVVGILVVVAGDLLLARSVGICLDM
jgi:hypothetical protein